MGGHRDSDTYTSSRKGGMSGSNYGAHGDVLVSRAPWGRGHIEQTDRESERQEMYNENEDIAVVHEDNHLQPQWVHH